MQKKIFFTMMLVALVPLVLAVSLEYYVVESAHRADVLKLETAVLAETGGEVTNFLNTNVLAGAKIIAPTGSNITIATSAQLFALQETFSALTFLQSESFVDLNGNETAAVDRGNPMGVPAADLMNVSSSTGFVAVAAGGNYVGPVTYGSSGPEISFGTPARGTNGTLIGAILGTADLYPLENVIAPVAIGNTGYLYLLDQSGKLLAGNGPLNATPAGTDFSSSPALAAPGTLAYYKNAEGTEVAGSAVAVELPGDDVQSGASAAPTTPAANWTLVAEWPASEADAVLNALLIRSAIAFVVVLILIILASFLLAQYIVRPIRKLQAGAARVAEGNFKEGVAIGTHDELGALGNSFNDMVQGLKRLQELKDEFVFVAAHELRTPVSAMKGYLELILGGATGGVNDATKQYIEKVIASNKRLIQLVNDLLEVARSEAGRLTIKVAPIDIVPAVRGTLDELKSLADEKSVKLVYEPPTNLPKLMGDEDRIKEVMVNLVGNAIKYMGGAGTVSVTHDIAGNGKLLVTNVRDTGLGISAEAQAKLFMKFYRVQTERTRDITGTGLGLFIVREIIEKMGGTISVKSEEGKGSTFSFALPTA